MNYKTPAPLDIALITPGNVISSKAEQIFGLNYLVESERG